MRDPPIYPHKFGSGIPNPVGPATFRGLQHSKRVLKIPENWGPLVSKKLDYSTATASFSEDQLRDIRAATSLVTDERRGEGEDLRRDDLIRKSKDLVQGWSHTKEYNKKQALMKLMKQEAEKKEKVEALSREEMEIELQRQRKVIADTEKLLTFSTERYKEIHSGMMLSEVLKERDIALKIKQEKDALQAKFEQEEDLKYLENVKKQMEKDEIKRLKMKDFEKEWDLKRQGQINDRKMQKAKDFEEEVAEVNRKIEVMQDEIKKEKDLQAVERLEREEMFKMRKQDLQSKHEKSIRDKEEEEAAYRKMYEIQDKHDQRREIHSQHFQARQNRIADRQGKAGHSFALNLAAVKDDTEEKIRKYNEDLEMKLFKESLQAEERENIKKLEKNSWYFQAEKEKHEKKLKEKEETLMEREKNALQVKDVHDELKRKKEASEQAQRKLNKFWSNQKKELEEKRRNKIDEDKYRLTKTLKGYNEEDDELERYVENLLLEEKSKDLNVHPIIKAKQSLTLGRGVPLIAADQSGIRLNPKPKNIFYKPKDSRERMSMTWNVPDKKPVIVNVNTKSQGTHQACIYKVDTIPIEDQ